MTGPEVLEDKKPRQQPDARFLPQESADFFSRGGPFEAFPGAVLHVGNNGIILAANTAGEAIGALLQGEELPSLREAIRSALNGVAGQVNPLIIDDRDDPTVQRAFDALVLPWIQGATALILGREITLERGLRAALVESRQRYKDLVDLSAEFAWECDLEGRFSFLSSESVLGHAADDLIGRDCGVLALKERRPARLPFLVREACRDQEVWMRTRDGETVCLAVTAVPLYDKDQGQVGTRGLCRDVTAERQRESDEADARYVERLLNYVLQMVRDQLDPRGMLRAAAEALQLAVGARGVAVYRLIPGVEFKAQARAGEAFPAQLEQKMLAGIGTDAASDVSSDEGQVLIQMTRAQGVENGLLCLWRLPGDEAWRHEERALVDVVALEVATAIEQLAREEKLERLSETDSLTALLNRRGFVSQLDARLERPGQGMGGALFYIDIDNFKQVNDTAGHSVGDELLAKAARMFQDQIRGEDLAGRLGGDEFTLYLEGIGEDAALLKAERLQRAWTSEIREAESSARVGGLSIGIAMLDEETQEGAASLIERADQAMYRVKKGGKGGHSLDTAGAGKRGNST